MPLFGSPSSLYHDHAQDLWTHTQNGTAVRNFTAHAVPAHGVVALLLKDAGDEPPNSGPPCARTDWCMDKNGTLINECTMAADNMILYCGRAWEV